MRDKEGQMPLAPTRARSITREVPHVPVPQVPHGHPRPRYRGSEQPARCLRRRHRRARPSAGLADDRSEDRFRGLRLLRQALHAQGRRRRGPLTMSDSDAGVAERAVESGFGPGSHLHLVDGSGFIFRAYHALPPLTRKSDGLPTGAVHGFCNMIWKMIEEATGPDAPTHVAVVFDKSEQTFRNELFDGYKAHRPPAPEDLVPQFPLIREAVRAFCLPCIELAGFEADDIIASYAEVAKARGGRVTIISADKDLMQLVGGGVEMVDTLKNRRIGPEEVEERFGVGPDRVVDVQALAGDSVDNVPGAPGIGIKTAAQLINEYGDLDTLLARAPEIRQPKRRQTLIEKADQIRLSRTLVTLRRDVPLPVPIEALELREPKAEKL